MMRSAISPRFAIRIFLNIAGALWLSRPDREQALAVLDRLAVLDVDVHHLAVVLGVDLVHQLHRFDDAEDLAFLDGGADLDKRRRARLRGPIEGADDWRLDDRELDLGVGGGIG